MNAAICKNLVIKAVLKSGKMKTDTLTEFANNLTSEQYLKLIEFIHGPIPQEIKEMTDDQILKELTK